MTPARESIVLPVLFLTVALLGGLRIGETVRLIPPSLTALVLSILLLGTLARGGVFLPQLLLNGSRRGVENASGAVVLLTLFAASAQAINLLVPERGLLHAAFAIFLFTQLMTMSAAGTGRGGTLRTLLVLLGSLFALRYIIVEALYAPDGGLLHRVLTALMSGATLGGIAYEPNAPVTGYIALLTLLLYVAGLLLLPSAPHTTAVERRTFGGPPVPTTVALLLMVAMAGCGRDPAETGQSPAAQEAPPAAAAATTTPDKGNVTPEQRAAALRRAQVWAAPAIPIGAADLARNPRGEEAFRESDVVECRLVVKAMGGTTPKFDCELPEKDVIRVKYGPANAELHAEVAATRLLSALGFGADRMFVVKAVRCAGCTAFPFQSLQCLASSPERLCFPGGIDYSRSSDFDFVVIERRMEGRRIEATADQGWAWYELDQVRAAAGGAPRAHVDGLRLLAVLLAHWDNKAENQRLVCLPGGDRPDGSCTRPFLILQDLGASFGPVKMDLPNWRAHPVWADARRCRVSMEHLPWGGGTFPEVSISEDGRRFLLGLLEQLSPVQMEALFAGARVQQHEGIGAESRQPNAWAAALQKKIQEIRQAGPCPG